MKFEKTMQKLLNENDVDYEQIAKSLESEDNDMLTLEYAEGDDDKLTIQYYPEWQTEEEVEDFIDLGYRKIWC